MPISHALIAYQETVLAEASITDGTFRIIARRILPKIGAGAQKKTFAHENHYYHFISDDEGLICMCRADKEMSNQLCFEFLNEIRTRFLGSYADEYKNGTPESYNDRFARTLKDRMDFYSNDEAASALPAISKEVENITQKMKENIDLSLGRSEQIEGIKNKSSQLRAESTSFRGNTKKVARGLWWKNAKMWIVMFIVFACVLIIVIIIFLVALKSVIPGFL